MNNLVKGAAAKSAQTPRQYRVDDGVVSVAESNQRWCSDRFEIACDNGELVTGVFMKDCCDREIIVWQAWAERGLPARRCETCWLRRWKLDLGRPALDRPSWNF